MNNKTVYFPGLNGLRAIAALAVVISHTTISLQEFNLNPNIFGTFKDGKPIGLFLAGYGVSIFFVLSGFLITYLLQAEKEMHPINIKKFYLRRILRIWPLYYLYLILAVLTIISFKLNLNIASLFLYIFYAANIPAILGTYLPFLNHYWSLGVEEQFYLFWPWMNKKINKLESLLFVLIFILIATKLAVHFFYQDSILDLALITTRFHCMLIGGLGAILYKKGNFLFFKVANNKLTQLICWVVIFFAAINKFHLASIIDNEIISFVGLFLIIGQINITNRIINLERNFLNFLGKISYGIYVIHPLVIFFLSKSLSQIDLYLPLKYVLVYLIIVFTTIFLSYLSYNYFECYFLNFKKRFVVVDSSNTKNSND